MKNNKKDFYTNRWLAIDAAAYVLAIVIGVLVGAMTFRGIVAVFNLENAVGNLVVAAVVTGMVITFVIAMIGAIALYDLVVEWRYGRERGLLRRVASQLPFTRA